MLHYAIRHRTACCRKIYLNYNGHPVQTAITPVLLLQSDLHVMLPCVVLLQLLDLLYCRLH